MAKNRDHKIMITDEAIEKVPLIKYKEIPESEYLMLQEFAKRKLHHYFCYYSYNCFPKFCFITISCFCYKLY